MSGARGGERVSIGERANPPKQVEIHKIHINGGKIELLNRVAFRLKWGGARSSEMNYGFGIRQTMYYFLQILQNRVKFLIIVVQLHMKMIIKQTNFSKSLSAIIYFKTGF